MQTDAAVWQVKSFSELSTQQLYKILQARIDVFVVEQNCPYPETDGYDDKALHLWAEKMAKSRRIAGFSQPELSTKFRPSGAF
jgi:ElaA protein